MKKNNFPSRKELRGAVLLALKNLGGEASVPEINQQVIEILDLPEDVVMLEDESGLGTKLEYRLRWIRTELRSSKMIENVQKGIWALVCDE